MSHILNHNFSFFADRNITKFCTKHSFWIGYSHILSKIATVIYYPCFKKETQELLLYLSFELELSTSGFYYISF